MREGYIAQIRTMIGTHPLMVPCSAGLLINPQGDVLLHLRADNRLWGLPGGALEPKENPRDSVVREVLEETGYQMNAFTLMDVFAGPQQYIRYPNGDEVYCVTIAYLCDQFTQVSQPDPAETLAIQFWPLKALPPDVHTCDQDVLQAACLRWCSVE